MPDQPKDKPSAPADSTPQRFCNCPVISPRQVEDGECSLCGLELEPEANSTRTEMPPSVMDDHKGVQAAKKWMQELLGHVGIGHITYACFEDKSGKGWSVPQLLNAYLSHLAASVQQEPPHSADLIIERLKAACNGHPDAKIPWPHRLLHETIDLIERLKSTPAAPRTQGSELDDWRESLQTALRMPNLPAEHWSELIKRVRALAAQPQPAPRPPACLWCEQGNKPVHRLQDGRWIEPCTAIPAQKEEELRDALESANSMCRSAMAITKRRGEKTNWETFEAQLGKSLETQHKVMYRAPASTDEEKGNQ